MGASCSVCGANVSCLAVTINEEREKFPGHELVFRGDRDDLVGVGLKPLCWSRASRGEEVSVVCFAVEKGVCYP